MFTQTLTRRVRRSPLLELLTGPHGVDRYTELVDPTWTTGEARAKVVAVRRQTPRSVTLTLEPNQAFTGFPAGQHINLTVEIDGRRRTRCYSPASAEGATHIELTIGRHDGGLVSTYLCDNARPGMVVGLDSVGGDFILPTERPRRILFVSGGSGITPVMSMLRTMRDEGSDREIAFIHYARSAEEACYADELAAMPGVRVLHGYTREGAGDLTALRRRPPGRRDARARTPLSSAVRPRWWTRSARHCPNAQSESFVRPRSTCRPKPPAAESRSPTAVSRSTDDGRPLLEQAEAAGLTPESGCRMGICHSCTRRKTRGAVTQPDHRSGVERRRGGRADLRVRPRRRRRHRALDERRTS